MSRIDIQLQNINGKEKQHTVAMTRFPGDTATPKHESNASLEICKEKMYNLVGKKQRSY